MSTRRVASGVIALALVLGGCSVLGRLSSNCGTGIGAPTVTGPIVSREAAIMDAMSATGLRQPMVVGDVQHGRFEDVYTGVHSRLDYPPGSPTSRLDRDAWAVNMSAFIGSVCGGDDAGTGPAEVQVVVDAQTGELLGAWSAGG